MRAWLAGVLLAASSMPLAASAERALPDAAQAGNVRAALSLLEKGAAPDAAQPDGSTALLWAAHRGEAELVGGLLAAGANASVENDYGAFPLAEASAIGSHEVIELLLSAGADPNRTNWEGETPLMATARTGNIRAAELLVAAGAEIDAAEDWGGQTALMWAVAQLQPDMAALLIAHGANVNARGAVRDWTRRITAEGRPKDMNKGGFTPLLYAARGGCLECARHLVEAGAHVDLADPDGVTPLILAIINFRLDVADFLIEAGADVNRWDLYGRTPLYAAIDINTIAHPQRPGRPYLNALPLAEKLLERGANPNAQLKLRRPPFRNAIGERGADNTLTTGATPLLRAAHGGDNDAIRLLLSHGALVDLPNAAGLTPLMAASGLGVGPRASRARFRTEAAGVEAVRMLLDAGADVHARIHERRRLEKQPPRDLGGIVRYNSVHMPPDGQTALHGAARRGWSDIVRVLVEQGADVHAVDIEGMTPLDMALGRYEPEPLDPPHEPYEETAALLRELAR